MKTSKAEYKKLSDAASPPTQIIKNILFAFLSGGIICTIGQGLYNLFMSMGAEKTIASGYVSMVLIGIAALLTALNVFDNIALVCGAGTLVPITGFSNSIAAPAMEYKSEGHVTGIGVKMFNISGPVLVFGICSSFIYGLIIWIFHLY